MSIGKVQIKPAFYKFHGESLTHARTDVHVRDRVVTTDEPAERGGTNVGASPTETMLSALVGCTNNIATKIAHHKKLEFEIESIDLEAEFDRRGVLMVEDIDIPFPNIKLTINVRTDATAEQLAEVQALLPQFCPVSKVFRAAGSKIVEEWNVVSPIFSAAS